MFKFIKNNLGFGKSPLELQAEQFQKILTTFEEEGGERASIVGKKFFAEWTDAEGVRKDVASFLTNLRIATSIAQVNGLNELRLALRSGSFTLRDDGQVELLSPHYSPLLEILKTKNLQTAYRVSGSREAIQVELVVTGF